MEQRISLERMEEAVSLFGSFDENIRILENEFFQALAKKYNKSAAQICLRFLIQKDIIPLVKSANFERMKENQNIFDFEISREDMQMLECMPQDTWLGEHPDFHIPKKTCNLNQ